MSEKRLKKLGEGKTKVIWDIGEDKVHIESKDDITAGDGAKRDLLEGKAVYSTETTSNCFKLLHGQGIGTHFLGRVDDRTFRARQLQMIPIELVARRIATGSYLKRRPDVIEGAIFPDIIVEFFEKDDANHDPLIIIDLASERILRFAASKPLSEGFMSEQPLGETSVAGISGSRMLELVTITRIVFLVLEKAWAKQNVALVDLKIECGLDFGRLLVGDVIDNDSWRIWPARDKNQMRDKQVYRDLQGVEDPAAKAKELGRIKQNYEWVAGATREFLTAN